MAKQLDLVKTIKDHWLANNAVMFLVTDETYRVWDDLKTAVEEIMKDRGEEVRVVAHDKVCGFHVGDPSLQMPKDKSNNLGVALPMMMEPEAVLAAGNADLELLFDPSHDIIFMLKDPNWELNESPGKPSSIQRLRSIIQSNMCSGRFHGTVDGSEDGERVRGKRMILLVSCCEKLPQDLPEVTPIIVPLPDAEMLDKAIENVLAPLAGRKMSGSDQQHPPLTPASRQRIVRALIGFTYQKAEDCLSLAVVENKSYVDLDAFVRTIEMKKAQAIEGIQGVRYVHKDEIPFDSVPGLEEVQEFADNRVKLPLATSLKHRVKPLKGMSLVGVPGTGKSLLTKVLGKRLGRDILFISLGEIKGSLVGQSQANLRRALNIIHALGAVAVFDDCDKGSMGTSASGYTGDGGTSAEMVQMLLTDMDGLDDPTGEQPVYLFSANRIANVPPELLRPGRMDERWFVQRPDAVTRLNILKLHLAHHLIETDDEKKLAELAGKVTEDWVGAELADLVTQAVVHSLANGKEKVACGWMSERARDTVCMANQETFKKDFAEMEEAAKQFRRVGRVKGSEPTPVPAPRAGRAGKSISI